MFQVAEDRMLVNRQMSSVNAVLSNVASSTDGPPATTITVTGTTSRAVVIFGVRFAVNVVPGAYPFSFTAPGAAASQSAGIVMADWGIVAGDTVYIQAYTNSDPLDGVGTRIYGTPTLTVVLPASGVSIDALSASGEVQNTVIAWSHTPVSGSITGVYVSASWFDSADVILSVTYGITAMTLITGADVTDPDGRRVSWYELPNPAQGVQLVTITYGTLANVLGNAISVTGSDTATGHNGNGVSATGFNGHPSATVTTGATGDLVVMSATCHAPMQTTTPGTGVTSMWDTSCFASFQGTGLRKAGAASVTIDGTQADGSNTWGATAFSIKKA